MQNYNGPCSFIAICNILLLRGDIELLSQLVAEHLLMTSPDVDVSAALSIMPHTQEGMDLNPLFTSATSFRPAGAGGELRLFEHVGIKLVHGWLVDPSSPEADVVAQTADYDSAVTLIADADHTAKGSSSNPLNWTDDERTKVEKALIIRQFLDNTQSQLTYYGLFNLASILDPGSLVALFRNSHLSVLYKSAGEEASLYTLVTDHVFLNEPSVVWERLEDVDGGWSTFVDSEFIRAAPAGGDFAGQTPEDALRAAEADAMQYATHPIDNILAQQLQEEEETYARRHHEANLLSQERKRRKKAKKKDCIIM
ncbi:hypothetical protein BD779DRAFT_1497035 [Infundibulicybe gibba]|nr:hypothetical protein BD779DRAFT_1497035 [Infundibulicybe gibba]